VESKARGKNWWAHEDGVPSYVFYKVAHSLGWAIMGISNVGNDRDALIFDRIKGWR